jgi:hypothetical protein
MTAAAAVVAAAAAVVAAAAAAVEAKIVGEKTKEIAGEQKAWCLTSLQPIPTYLVITA